ncbi:hypothetical protein PL75_06700 [Neisseria arctica]|uniref:Transferrin-binding protein B C-lobe/N-lobe beta-barrel domain-containing protein n=1 Tax=Neisseria arctica TaxID=1470200 RepID=A0A0J0YRL4_9NEIS|nr:transferrin-binding protein-like solute binding protein [Neisseria arctica]KLT72760.1 hypothetical protein PL75_06700 [Neisseria arctica]UOO87257.1 transferrin-binding protein-like solute binding protein [Neisseria arctica]
MFRHKLGYLNLCLLAVYCTGCASGGGSLEVDKIPDRSSNIQRGPVYIKGDTPTAADQTELGYTVTVPWGEDWEKHGVKAVTETRVDKDASQYDAIRFVADDGKKEERLISLKHDGEKWYPGNGLDDVALESDLAKHGLFGKRYGTDFREDTSKETRLREHAFEYSKVGFVDIVVKGEKRWQDKMYRNIYYKGQNKTADMPVGGTAEYSGTWEYATRNQVSSNGFHLAGSQPDNGRFSKQNTADFKVDFGSKTLNGALKAQNSNRRGGQIHYDISANISGNGFRGEAVKNTKGTTLFEDDSSNNPLDDKADVSGSFFGPKASELAGRLNGKTGSIVGVFAAEQKTSDGIKTDGKQIHSSVLRFNPEMTKNYQISESAKGFENNNFSGDIKLLQLDGMLIELDKMAEKSTANPICCDVFDFVRLGRYFDVASQTSNKAGYFIQGHVTPESDMPVNGKAKYNGFWYGYGFSSQDGKGVLFSGSKLDADFTADFSNKKLLGNLHSAAGVPGAVEFAADIKGNGFSTDKAILKINADSGNNLSRNLIAGEGRVHGHFYGSKANELGGTVTKDDHSFAAVFGAKQIK